MRRTRRTFTAEEKLKVVMAVIQDGKSVSDVARDNNIHPNLILNWKVNVNSDFHQKRSKFPLA